MLPEARKQYLDGQCSPSALFDTHFLSRSLSMSMRVDAGRFAGTSPHGFDDIEGNTS
jgi:hypothetical protein